ncbi:MAG TPA: ABC transporter substrate-binding protein [Roseiarcus sp.]|nr:ABC transporter substrate-binding protein [Roseiarcus sp.]
MVGIVLRSWASVRTACVLARALCPAALAIFPLAGASIPAWAEPGVAQDSITFGQAAAFTGPAAALGLQVRTGLLAAFAEANQQGGVNGRQLKLITYDDGYEPDRSIEATRKLLEDDKVFALIGAVGTPTSSATEPMAAKAGAPFIGAFTGAEFLREPFDGDVINIRASYFQETETLVERFTQDEGFTRIAVFYQDDAFGRAGLSGVQKALSRRGMTVAGEGAFERNTTAVKMATLAIRAGNPQAVIMIGPYTPCAEFVRTARRLGMNAQFAGISFLGSDAFSKELGPEATGAIVTQVMPSPADASLPVVARYREALKAFDPAAAPNPISLEGYIAARLTIAILEKTPGAPTREGFLAAIRGASFDLGGVTLSYGPSDNRGSNRVYLTVIGPDGASRSITTLKEPRG